jgi:hypothetical protein
MIPYIHKIQTNHSRSSVGQCGQLVCRHCLRFGWLGVGWGKVLCTHTNDDATQVVEKEPVAGATQDAPNLELHACVQFDNLLTQDFSFENTESF